MIVAVSDDRAIKGKVKRGDGSEEDNARERREYNQLNGSWRNQELDALDLCNRVVEGFAFTAALNIGERGWWRHSRYFKSSQVLALDFDSGDSSSAIGTVASVPFIATNASFVYTTPSHTEDKPRCRAVFVTDKPIARGNIFGELNAALIHRFGGTVDKSCKDPARFYYGSKGGQRIWIGNTLQLSTVGNQLIATYRKFLAELEAERVAKYSGIKAPTGDEGVWAKHVASVLKTVREAANEKHYVLINAARALGGYVASGYYSFDQASSWLEKAIGENPNDVRSMSGARNAIQWGLEAGMSQPLHYERTLENITPPLLPAQRAQVEQYVKRKVLQERDAIIDAWGLSGQLIEELNLSVVENYTEDGEIIRGLRLPLGSNVETRYGKRYEYEDTSAAPAFVHGDGRMIFCTTAGALAAINAGVMDVAGLPQIPVLSDTVPDGVVMMEPGATMNQSLRNRRIKVASLPFKVDYLTSNDLKSWAERAVWT